MSGLVVVAAALVFLAGCGGSANRNSSANPAEPSSSAKMICAPQTQAELATALMVSTTQPVTTSWRDQIYSCRYVYSNAEITLSVKELTNKDATTDYYNTLQRQLGDRKTLTGPGEGAFFTGSDSVVVRKDFKVLNVDVTRLPPTFENPPVSRAKTALDVATVIMACWTGA